MKNMISPQKTLLIFVLCLTVIIVIIKFNDTKNYSLVFSGNSPSWDATYTEHIFLHSVNNTSNNLNGNLIIEYKKPKKITTPINYVFKSDSGDMSLSGVNIISSDGHTVLGSTGSGGGSLPNVHSTYTIKIKWENKEETIHLAAKQ